MTTNQRKHYVRVAKELGYSKDVINRIKEAKTEFEATQALTTARKRLCEEANYR